MHIAFPGKHCDTYEFIYNLSINSSGFRCGWFGCWKITEPLLALLASKSLSNSWQPTKVVHKISVSLAYCHFEQLYRLATLWNSLTCVCMVNKYNSKGCSWVPICKACAGTNFTGIYYPTVHVALRHQSIDTAKQGLWHSGKDWRAAFGIWPKVHTLIVRFSN